MARVPFKEGGYPLPFQMRRPLAAAVAPARGQLLMGNSAGYAILVAGDAPNGMSLGPADRDQSAGSAAGDASMVTWTTFVSQYINSTISGDGFTNLDMAAVAWGVDYETVGKKSNDDGDNRSMVGLVFGFDSDNQATPLVYVGPIAWCLARAVHMAEAKARAWLDIADAAPSTATAERAIPSEKFHGLVTAIEFVGAAIVASDTDYITVTMAKRGLADAYAAATTIGTYDSRAANNGAVTAFTPAAFTLVSNSGGALNLLETDVITITVVKGGSGKTLTGAFRVLTKVQ